MSARDFSITVEIDAPPEIVWEVMSDVERWHEWTASISSIRRLDPGPFQVGSRAKVRQPKFPPAVWKVTAIEPGREFTWKSEGFGFVVYGSHAVTAQERGSRVTLALHYTGVLGGLLASLTRGITERYLKLEAEGLKRRSESMGQ